MTYENHQRGRCRSVAQLCPVLCNLMVREVGGSYSWVVTICQERGEFLEAPNGPWDEMLLNGLRQESLRRFSKKEGFPKIPGNALRAGREQRPDCSGLRRSLEACSGAWGREGCAGTTLPSSWLGQKENEGSSRETWERGRFYFLIRDAL